MNLLFVLGNGFDLQLGLPTSYHDFYQYYVNTPSSSEAIARLKDEISADQQNWSDLELALGKITADYSDVDTFCEVYDDIQIELQRYLLKLDELMQAGTLAVNSNTDILYDCIVSPEKHFSKELRESIVSGYNEIFSIDNLSQIDIHILTFNYTHTIEYLLRNPNLPSLIPKSNSILRYLRHIHRDLSPSSSVWLGVDNDEQIQNESFQSNEDIRLRLIKPEILNEVSPFVFENITSTISDADAICLFGVSLGDTDQTWVKKIGNKIANGTLTMLFAKDDAAFKTDNSRLVYQRRYKKAFIEKLKNLGLSFDEKRLELYVEINSSIFTRDAPNPHEDNLKILHNALSIQKNDVI